MVEVTPGADVEVLAGGTSLFRGVSRASGVFTVPAKVMLPSEFRVIVTPNGGTSVERYVSGPVPYLWVNAITHLVSRYKQAHPELSLAEAESAVRRGLGLAPNAPLYGISDSSASPFSHQKYLQAAAAAGGFQAYSEQVVSGIGAGQTFSFVAEAPASTTLLSKGVVESSQALIALAGSLLTTTATNIFNTVDNALVGKVAGALGLNIGTTKQLNEIQSQLDEVNSELESLTSLVSSYAAAGLLNTVESALNTTLTNLNTANQAVYNNAINATKTPTYSGSSGNNFNHGPGVVPGTYNSLVTSYSAAITDSATNSLTTALTSTNQTSNVQTLIANQTMLIYGDTEADATTSYYDLRRDPSTRTLQNNLNSLAGWTTVAAMIFSENGNSYYLPPTLSTAGYSPPAPSLNTALQNVTALASMLHQAQQAPPKELGTDLVFIDLEANLMWYLVTDLGEYNAAQNGMIGLEVNGWGYAPGVSPPSPVGSSVSSDLVGFSRSPDQPGWRLAETGELQTLYQRVVAAGGGNGNDSNTLKALQKLGFTGLVSNSDNYKKIWANDPNTVEYLGLPGSNAFHYFDMATGKTTDDTSEDTDPRADPSYTIVYVRSIPDADFKDTVDQALQTYNIPPSSVQIQQASAGNSGADMITMNLYGELQGYNLTNPYYNPTYGSIESFSGLANLGARTTWTVSNTATAYLTYQGTNALAVFNQPGNVTVTASYRAASGGPVRTAQVNLSSTRQPVLQSVLVSPFNMAYQSRPGNRDFIQFYCTGYLANGVAVDLTQNVAWSVFASNNTPVAANVAAFSTVFPLGTLIFGAQSLPSNQLIVNATYRAGSISNATWTDNGTSFTGTSTFTFQ